MSVTDHTTVTASEQTRQAARRLRELSGAPILVLPNVWDAASATLAVAAGAEALATTSGGVAWSLGRADGERAGRDEMLAAAARITAAVPVPVTVDIEGGYGSSPDEVAGAVLEAVRAGAAGVNLEDSRSTDGTLYTADEQAARLRSARDAARTAGLSRAGPQRPHRRLPVRHRGAGRSARRRARRVRRRTRRPAPTACSCRASWTSTSLAELCTASPLPINVMAGPGAPSVAELAAVGVRRVTVGTSIAQAAYSVAFRATAELLRDGTLGALEGALDVGTVNGMFAEPLRR